MVLFSGGGSYPVARFWTQIDRQGVGETTWVRSSCVLEANRPYQNPIAHELACWLASAMLGVGTAAVDQ
jgi:hypothetical protein